MRFAFGILFSVAVLALAIGCGKKDSTSGSAGSTASLEGTYVLVEMDFMGMKMTEAEMKGKSESDRTYTIKGNQMIAMKNGKEDPATFTTDTTKTPAHIDLVGKEEGKAEKMYGIYKLDGDTLTMCITMTDKADERPKDFKIDKDAKGLTMIMTLKKKK